MLINNTVFQVNLSTIEIMLLNYLKVLVLEVLKQRQITFIVVIHSEVQASKADHNIFSLVFFNQIQSYNISYYFIYFHGILFLENLVFCSSLLFLTSNHVNRSNKIRNSIFKSSSCHYQVSKLIEASLFLQNVVPFYSIFSHH